MNTVHTKRRQLPRWAHRLPRFIRDTERGQALVEFTMVLPILLILLFALVDFGRAFYTWLLVTNAAREGARIAAVQADMNAVQDRIYSSFCESYPSDCSLDPDKLTWTNQATANIQGTRGDPVAIDLEYDFEFATPMGAILQLIGGDDLGSPTITAHSSMRLE
jgi:Flp pilus assembly protein TadG